MDVLYPHIKFGGDRFTHGDVRTKIREFLCNKCFAHAYEPNQLTNYIAVF